MPVGVYRSSASAFKPFNSIPIGHIHRTSRRSPRFNSTLSTPTPPKTNRIRNFFYSAALLLSTGAVYIYATDTRASIHRYVVVPAVRTIFPDAEDAHHAGVKALQILYQLGLHPRERLRLSSANATTPTLSVNVFDTELSSPLGVSGGLDKNAVIPDALFALGAGVVEVGGITPLPQPGNPRPRVFRLKEQQALINRYGLNSEGADAVAARLRTRVREFAYRHGLGIGDDAEQAVLDGAAGVPPGSLTRGCLLAVQIAKNKNTPDGDLTAVARDYSTCVEKLGKYADVLVVNVSSPNTPGLRDLQRVEPLTRILAAVVDAASNTRRKSPPKIMVKISPDEDDLEQIRGICEAVTQAGVDGIIVGNTTRSRPAPKFTIPPKEFATMDEQGGYSGPRTFDQTLSLVKTYRRELDFAPVRLSNKTRSEGLHSEQATTETTENTQGNFQMPLSRPPELTNPYDLPPKTIFASGGISTGEQALAVLNAGASLAMMYTALSYNGVGHITTVKREMEDAMYGTKQLSS
ncbi:dihydroorotate reductase pyre [Eremomyces bilateralis CBS 781.70]|uniref:Dihydroorotate dehydrogenase (quinone), mitochondrial n=1 Tax=Eremomyces bilateralis CBS 781.70 TaxID=1392243 RepID=A0A6G1G5Q5_9PEZI|nr:dihydroorotate reductase pyre [Eremomyces bilateralis CBS 781.70]KAF1813342.1 dihydroorotate reductase pyre [Eremomyces bilateralis CBS 781.70]